VAESDEDRLDGLDEIRFSGLQSVRYADRQITYQLASDLTALSREQARKILRRKRRSSRTFISSPGRDSNE
jgi:DNA-binding transcriptional regulator PaaX